MAEPEQKVELSPVAEGLVGGLVGAILGGVLFFMNVISAPAILGIVVGVGAGSWFNAWRRARKKEG